MNDTSSEYFNLLLLYKLFFATSYSTCDILQRLLCRHILITNYIKFTMNSSCITQALTGRDIWSPLCHDHLNDQQHMARVCSGIISLLTPVLTYFYLEPAKSGSQRARQKHHHIMQLWSLLLEATTRYKLKCKTMTNRNAGLYLNGCFFIKLVRLGIFL